MKQWKKITAALLAAVLLAVSVPMAWAVETQTYLTRGQTADLLLQAAEFYHPGVQRTNILKGYPGGNLDENGEVTRVQALVMLQRAFGELPEPKGDNARSGYPAENFTDVPAWAREALKSVFSSGIVAGTSATTLSPNDPITDGQLNLLIQRTYALEGSNLKDDFYATVNKQQLDSSVILPGYTSAGTFTDLSISASDEVRKIIWDMNNGGAKTDGEKKIVALYNNILDMNARNAAGIAPIQGYLTAIDNAKSVGELMQVHNQVAQALNSQLLLGFGLTVDAKDSDCYQLVFGGFSPGLGQGGYAAATSGQKTAYLHYLATLFQLVGQTSENAARQAQLIWDTDSTLAARSLTNQELGDVDKTYNLYTMAQLQALFPQVNLNALFAQTGLTQTDKIVVTDVGAMETLASLFDDAHLDILKAYCRLGLAGGNGAMLSQPFLDAQEKFQQEYLGTAGSLSREDTASQYVQSLMSDYLSQAYVARCFSPSAKADVEGMVQDILHVYRERIQKLDWMSDVTKAKAIRKLDTMKLHIGYPDTWQDDLKDTPILTTAQGGSFFDNVVAIRKTYHEKTIQMQKDGVDKTLWAMEPYTVNACYDPTVNSITFPAGILQAPFYDENAAYEKNLGSIGYVIAHEITHAFDNNGAKYDENGNATNWWTDQDYAAFQELCDKVVTLYQGRESAPGITCNGALTLSENIADIGSAACLTELEGKRARPDYQALYTAMSQIWCSSYTREMKQYLAQADLHAPDKLRGSLVLQNFQQYYDAFGIQEDDGMWLPPQDRVTIW